jgi:hypothetical protein
MAHDVFISHSSRDKPVSDAVCAALERAGIRCWVAPRDVQPGRSFAGEITRAIQQSKAMVMIFSANSNTSEQVLREVQLAVDSQLHILQFRIEEVLLNDDLKYYLSTPHWLDALTPPLENHLARLSASMKTLLGKPDTGAVASDLAPIAERRGTDAVAPNAEELTAPVLPGITPVKSPQRNFWMPALFAAVVLGATVLGLILLRRSEQLTNQVEPQTFPMPVVKSAATPGDLAVPPSAATTRNPFRRSWDFSAGMLHDVRTEGVELVDGSTWKMTGGKHLRFLTGGRSFLEATFDVPDRSQAPTHLTVRHLSSSPDGKGPGFSPVRITLNGGEIFRGSPAGKDWMEEQFDLGHYVQPGGNTLLFEYLDGAQTHYWLKSFRLDGRK